MAHVPRTHDQAYPAPDQFNLRVELLPLDDLAASMLLAGGPQMADGFAVRRDHGDHDAHVSVLITTDAWLAERTTSALPSTRRLVVTVLLADTVPDGFSCPYILCTPRPEKLASLIIELRRLFLEPSLIGIDFTDYAPLFQHPGQIHFAQQILSQGTSQTATGAELGQQIIGTGGKPISLILMLDYGENFSAADASNSDLLLRIDQVATAILEPVPDERLDHILVAAYRPYSSEKCTISAFYTAGSDVLTCQNVGIE
ncbi:MAG: hypothetical protein B7Z67_13965 [Acidiphilium sp. 21-60-14]|nr:MAG: hypothetical protein B7Z67_13965 [Acidiphilium sp. 21-60-14]